MINRQVQNVLHTSVCHNYTQNQSYDPIKVSHTAFTFFIYFFYFFNILFYFLDFWISCISAQMFCIIYLSNTFTIDRRKIKSSGKMILDDTTLRTFPRNPLACFNSNSVLETVKGLMISAVVMKKQQASKKYSFIWMANLEYDAFSYFPKLHPQP